MKPHKVPTQSDNQVKNVNNNFLNELKLCEMLKVSAFYLEKQKSFIPKKIIFQAVVNSKKRDLFTDPIFSDGFDMNNYNELQDSKNQSAIKVGLQRDCET